jgi:hypothetical protein
MFRPYLDVRFLVLFWRCEVVSRNLNIRVHAAREKPQGLKVFGLCVAKAGRQISEEFPEVRTINFKVSSRLPLRYDKDG